MRALEQIQAAMMKALEHGPAFLPDDLFTGPYTRVLSGMKVHANTISHARLVALEHTFPRVRTWLGHERFNACCRQYLERPGVTARTLGRIGELFPDYLAEPGPPPAVADLARFEWLWLEAYHAAEAPWLSLADLAGIQPEVLMEVAVKAHPAASARRYHPDVIRSIGEEASGLAHAYALLVTRPEGQVVVSAATPDMLRIFCAVAGPVTIGNLLAGSGEPDFEDQLSPENFMPALIALLGAGALQRVG